MRRDIHAENVIKPVVGAGALLAALVAAAPSYASVIYIGASKNGTTITTEAHGPGITAPVVWDGTYDSLSVSISGADPQPALPRFGSTELTASTHSKKSGTVYFFVSETGLHTSPTTMSLDSYFSGNLVPAGWSITETTWLDDANVRYGMGMLLATDTFGPGGPYASPAFPSLPASASPYSLTEEYAITWTGKGSVLSTEKIVGSIAAIPEVSTWGLMVIGFAGLGFAGFRKNRKGRLAPAF